MTISRNLASFANNLDASGNIAGVNISIANVSGTLAVTNGGTGLTAAGLSGNVLTSNGTAFISTAPAPGLSTGKAIAMSMIFGF